MALFFIWPLFRGYGRNPGKKFFVFLGDLKTPKGHFEINWPLESLALLGFNMPRFKPGWTLRKHRVCRMHFCFRGVVSFYILKNKNFTKIVFVNISNLLRNENDLIYENSNSSKTCFWPHCALAHLSPLVLSYLWQGM